MCSPNATSGKENHCSIRVLGKLTLLKKQISSITKVKLKNESQGFPYQCLNRVFLMETNHSLIAQMNHFKQLASETPAVHSAMMIVSDTWLPGKA